MWVESHRVCAVADRGDVGDPGGGVADGELPLAGAPAIAVLERVGRLLIPVGPGIGSEQPPADLLAVFGCDQQIGPAVTGGLG